MDPSSIFASLGNAKWITAGRTYGNCHKTLIGIMVDWWIGCDATHYVLDGCPSCSCGDQSGHKYGDALYCDSNGPVGILEVEGNSQIEAAQKLERFFGSLAEDLTEKIQFAVLLFYSTKPKNMAKPIGVEVEAAVRQVSSNHPGKDLIVICLEKTRELVLPGIRMRSDYFAGAVSSIHGSNYRGGKKQQPDQTFFSQQRPDVPSGL